MPECRWCRCCDTLHVFSSSAAAGVRVGGKPWRGCDGTGAASRMLCVQEVNRLWQPPRLSRQCMPLLCKASKLILSYPSLCQTVLIPRLISEAGALPYSSALQALAPLRMGMSCGLCLPFLISPTQPSGSAQHGPCAAGVWVLYQLLPAPHVSATRPHLAGQSAQGSLRGRKKGTR